MYPTSDVAGRMRIKFENLCEKKEFIKNMKNIPGLKKLEESEETTTVLVEYEVDSPFDYVLKNISFERPEPKVSRTDIYYYVSKLLPHPAVKAIWSIGILGPKRGFLTFAICSMCVNRFLKATIEG